MIETDDTETTDSTGLETQVLWNRLQATADEMYDAAERLAYSFPFEREPTPRRPS
ncbi:hypothetical protein [Natrinema sp. SYSU A 869]|uniref:hypothetical protein n=1 Tax=Natrinema sp. SYSU A 869 TaxID=2871694 RepID=UPI001CA406AA|nr:hypothetical protein [Natrinema sp. SYSU A 869]